MNPERWERIKELFGRALDLEREEQEAFLKKTCPDDEIYQEVLSLLAANEGGDFLRPGNPILPQPAPELTEGMLLKQRYRVGQEIGRGGFATVFLATDQHLHNRRVVIKVLREQAAEASWSEARFQDEIRSLSMIDHPGVIGLLDAGQADGHQYLVMQYAEGQTLRSLIGPTAMPFDRIAGLITQVGQAVGAAHKLGIIHQDIKPDNIMVQVLPEGGDRVRLIDFGIARLRSENTAMVITRAAGSPSYMAPEQLLRRPSAASDIFGIGIVRRVR
jgi:serine/threonine-protein kinase